MTTRSAQKILHVLVFTSVASAQTDNWPAWRGPEGTGVSRETSLPVRWSDTENVRWRVPLPDRGNSTPVVWGKRIFITQAIETEERRTLMCFDRADGKLLWQSGVTYAEKELTHRTNPYCSASPVTDGTRVIAFFGSAGLYCYNYQGNELWHRELGKISHMAGSGASPIVHDDLYILNFGPGDNAALLALDKSSGRIVWRFEAPRVTVDDLPFRPPMERMRGGFGGSWSTPIVIRANGREELIMSFAKKVCALDPQTGRELWFAGGLGPHVTASPAWGDGIVVVMAGGMSPRAFAVKPGGEGDVTSTQRNWHTRVKECIGSGVITEGCSFSVSESGVAECLELATGKSIWQERLSGASGNNGSWSSIVLADGKLYVPNQSGDVFVLRAGRTFEVISVNSVRERTNASLAVSDSEIFLRTERSLWCLGGKKI